MLTGSSALPVTSKMAAPDAAGRSGSLGLRGVSQGGAKAGMEERGKENERIEKTPAGK